jgi:hypothetical protein
MGSFDPKRTSRRVADPIPDHRQVLNGPSFAAQDFFSDVLGNLILNT